MQQKHDGFVLLIVLIYLQLITMLGAEGLNYFAAFNRQLFLQRQHFQLQQEAQSLLDEIELATPATCLKTRYSTKFLLQQTRKWWRDHGCRGNKGRTIYYYLQEDLGVNSCAIFYTNNKPAFPAHYYRTTLLIDSGYSVIAQSVMALPERSDSDCHEVARSVTGKRQSFRWLR